MIMLNTRSTTAAPTTPLTHYHTTATLPQLHLHHLHHHHYHTTHIEPPPYHHYNIPPTPPTPPRNHTKSPSLHPNTTPPRYPRQHTFTTQQDASTRHLSKDGSDGIVELLHAGGVGVEGHHQASRGVSRYHPRHHLSGVLTQKLVHFLH